MNDRWHDGEHRPALAVRELAVQAAGAELRDDDAESDEVRAPCGPVADAVELIARAASRRLDEVR